MEIIVRYLFNAPTGFHGMVTRNPDDSYTVLLDPNDSRERQLKTCIHEMSHILNDDFSKSDVQLIERESHENIQTQLLRRNRETSRKDLYGPDKDLGP